MTATASRRTFLRGTLAGAAALAAPAVHAEETASDRRVQPLRWGVIGTGSRFRGHAAALRALPAMPVVAACDVHAGRLRAAIERLGGAVAACSDYRKLLENPEVDSVLICTPNMFHREMVLAALQAGKHVLCEKPMATTPKDCAALQKAAAATDRTLLYGLQLRYAGRYRDLRKVIQSGRIGAPQYLSLLEYRGDWNRGDVWQYPDPRTGRSINWRYSRVASGGTLNEKCCHYFDILNWMAGAVPQRVSCTGGLNHYTGRETWDHASVALEYPGGVKGSLLLSMYGPHRLDLQVIGAEGSLQLLEDHILFQKTGARAGEKIALTPEVDHGERGPSRGTETAVLRMYEDFRECVRTGKKPEVDGGLALASSKIAFLAERSQATGRAVGWKEL